MNKFLSLFLVALLGAGCETQPSNPSGEKQPKHAASVKIAIYDSSPREKSGFVKVFDDPKSIQKPYKEIALLNCEGTPKEEAPMTEAIIYRARILGANAIIILPPSRSGWGDRRVFRAKAIVFE